LGDDVWFAGHSTWTYALFSGGIIGLLGHLLLFGGTALNSLRCAAANARLPGPDFWLAFLPFIATAAFLSETATSNPFYERLAGMIYGVMAGLPQAFHVRAGFLPRLSAPA
jgi:O-antigen ligase